MKDKTNIYSEQESKVSGDANYICTRIKLASKRNYCWVNSHNRSIMEVRTSDLFTPINIHV